MMMILITVLHHRGRGGGYETMCAGRPLNPTMLIDK